MNVFKCPCRQALSQSAMLAFSPCAALTADAPHILSATTAAAHAFADLNRIFPDIAPPHSCEIYAVICATHPPAVSTSSMDSAR